MNDLMYGILDQDWSMFIDNFKTVKKVKAKERIFIEGDEVKGVYIIEKGYVKVTSTFGEKNERILRLSKHGMILGHRSLLSKNYNISAEALTDVVVWFIPLNVYNLLLKGNPIFSQYLIEFLIQDLCQSEELQRLLTIQDVRQRIAFIIIKLSHEFGYKEGSKGLLSHTISRRDFATIANTTYETVIRTLSLFEEKKLIKNVGKEIFILNEKSLKKLASGKE